MPNFNLTTILAVSCASISAVRVFLDLYILSQHTLIWETLILMFNSIYAANKSKFLLLNRSLCINIECRPLWI